MKDAENWKIFESTGSIADYLQYKNELRQQSEAKDGEPNADSDRRNCDSRDQNRGI